MQCKCGIVLVNFWVCAKQDELCSFFFSWHLPSLWAVVFSRSGQKCNDSLR